MSLTILLRLCFDQSSDTLLCHHRISDFLCLIEKRVGFLYGSRRHNACVISPYADAEADLGMILYDSLLDDAAYLFKAILKCHK